MGTEGLSISDAMSIARDNDFGGNGVWIFFLFFLLAWGGNGFIGNRGDYGQYATAASQQDILFSSKFSALDNKIDRIGNGIADATFALNNSIKDGNAVVAGRVVDEGRAIQSQIADCCCANKEAIAQVRYDMANFNNQQISAIHAEGEATRSLLQQNKIETLQGQINQLQLQNALCGVVRYPNATTYSMGVNPFCNCNNGCCCG